MNPSDQITARIDALGDWSPTALARLRAVIRPHRPISSKWKWGTPVWPCQENVLAVGALHDHVRLNFLKGALLDDPGVRAPVPLNRVPARPKLKSRGAR